MIRVGYGRADITPDFSVPLAGFGNSSTRMSQGYVNRQYATCIAITDEKGSTVLLITQDQCTTPGSWARQTRARIKAATGLSEKRIMISSTHNHSSPDVGNTAEPSIARFQKFYDDKLVEAALAALADRSEAKIETGRAVTGPLNHVRHYYMSNGTTAGDNYGDLTVGTVLDHTTQADRRMQLIRFTFEGKPDIVLVNWQAHPTVSATAARESGRALRPFLSADFVGTCRDYVEKEIGCRFAYFQGAAGNLNSRTYMQDREYVPSDVHVYGKELGNTVLEGLANMKPVQDGAVQCKQIIYSGELDHSDDYRYEAAQEIARYWRETNDRLGCLEKGKPHDIHSPYHANAIVARHNMGETISMELDAIRVGDISFVTAPYEMFDTNGAFIKDNTPVDMTFVLTYANDHVSYVASAEAFDYGCYEADIRRFTKGTAEKVAQILVDAVAELKNA